MDTIVVGIDGSEQSSRALRWALDHASALNARLVAIQAWSVPVTAYGGAVYVTPVDPDDFERATRTSLEATVAAIQGGVPEGVEVEWRTAEGTPAAVLLDAARKERAALLVVGSRGHGGFAGLLLGSVSATLTHHARCPLLIVPPADEAH